MPVHGAIALLGSFLGATSLYAQSVPAVSIGTPSQAFAKSGVSVSYTLTYTGATAITLTSADIIQIPSKPAGSGGPVAANVTITGSGVSTRVITFAGFSGNGDLGFSIKAGTASNAAGSAGIKVAARKITVDTTPPTLTIMPPAVTAVKSGMTAVFVVKYTGASAINLSDATKNKVGMTSTGTANAEVAVSGTGTATRTITLSGLTGNGTMTLSIAGGTSSDAAGNADAGAVLSIPLIVDNTPPTVTVGAPSAGHAKGSSVIDFTVTWSGAAKILLTPKSVTLVKTDSASALIKISGTSANSRTVSLSGFKGNGTIAIGILAGSAVDAAGNPAVASAANSATFNVDTTPPAMSVGAASRASANSSHTVSFMVTYTGASAITLSASDIVLKKTGTADATASVTGSGTTSRTLSLGGLTGNGTVSVSIKAGTATDAAGNSAPGVVIKTPVILDSMAPLITLSNPSKNIANASSSIQYTVRYTGASAVTLSPANPGDITLNSTGTANATVSVAGTDAKMRVVTLSSFTGNGALTLSIGAGTATDAASNPATAASNTVPVVVDTAPPTISIGSPVANISGNVVTVSFPVAYSGASAITLTPDKVSVAGTGSAVATQVSVKPLGPSSRIVSLAGFEGSGTMGITIAAGSAVDAAGNLASQSSASPSFSVGLPAGVSSLAITGVALTSPSGTGTSGYGKHIDFTVTTNAAVIVTGAPALPFQIGGVTRSATYVSGNATNSLVFRYTTTAGDNGLVTWDAGSITGGGIVLWSSPSMTLSRAFGPGTTTHTIDTVAPEPPSMSHSSQSFAAPFAVTISNSWTADTSFKEIRYVRLSGITADPPADCVSGTALASGGRVAIPSATTTLAVIACDHGGNASSGLVMNYTYSPLPTPTPDVPVTDGTVYGAAISGNTMYVGGSFNYIGPKKDARAVVLSTANGQKACDPNWDLDNQVNAVASVPGGGWLVGGSFTKVSGQARPYLFKVMADCSVDPLFDAGLDGSVNRILIDGSRVHIGGAFYMAGGARNPFFATLDLQTGSQAIAWNVRPVSQTVSALALNASGHVLVGGSFPSIGSFVGGGAPFSLATGNLACASFPEILGTVSAAVPDGQGGWYVGGGFTKVGSASRNNLAKINADCTLSDWNPAPDANVSALFLDGNTLYVGGGFSTVGGQPRSYLAAVDRITGVPTAFAPAIVGGNRSVSALTVVGQTVFFGGSFATVGGVARNHLGAVNKETGAYVNWNPQNSTSMNYISAIVPSPEGDTLYVAGDFTSLGGQSRAYVGEVSISTGLATAWNPSPANANCGGGNVNTLLVTGSTVYLGGWFITVGGQSRSLLAAVNRTDGSVTPWNANVGVPGSCSTTNVSGLAISGSDLLISGKFSTAGGAVRNNIAALDTSTALATSWYPQINSGGPVVVAGNQVFVGSRFSAGFVTNSKPGLAALDPQTGNATSWDPALTLTNGSPTVAALAVSGSKIYAAGNWTTIGGQTRGRLAAIDDTTGLATTFNPSPNIAPVSLLAAGSTLYVGGRFTTIASTSKPRLAAFDTGTDTLITTFSPPTPGIGGNIYSSGFLSVNSMAFKDSVLYIGGHFGAFGGIKRMRLAALDAASGALVTGYAPYLMGTSGNSSVVYVAIDGSTIMVGGSHLSFGGVERSSLAAFNMTTGEVTSWNPGTVAPTGSFVSTLEVVGSSLYLGGTFTSIAGQTRNYAAELDVATGTMSAWNPNPGYIVYAFFKHESQVYLGGSFTTIGGVARNYLARVDATSGALDTSWNPNPTMTGYQPQVTRIVGYGDKLYVSGTFNAIGGQSRVALAQLDRASGNATSFDTSLIDPSRVYSAATNPVLMAAGDILYVAGPFTSIGGVARTSMAAIDMSTNTVTSFAPVIVDGNIAGGLYGQTIFAKSMALAGSQVVVDGATPLLVNGTSRLQITGIDPSTSLSTAWTGLPLYSERMIYQSGMLYLVGGQFYQDGTVRGYGVHRVTMP